MCKLQTIVNISYVIVHTHIIGGEYWGITLVISVLDTHRGGTKFCNVSAVREIRDGLYFRCFFATRADGFSGQRAKEFFFRESAQ